MIMRDEVVIDHALKVGPPLYLIEVNISLLYILNCLISQLLLQTHPVATRATLTSGHSACHNCWPAE